MGMDQETHASVKASKKPENMQNRRERQIDGWSQHKRLRVYYTVEEEDILQKEHGDDQPWGENRGFAVPMHLQNLPSSITCS